MNGFYEADTFSLEFDARLLPFDPDQVAYLAIRIYMWDSQTDSDRAEWATLDNLMISGLADDIETCLVGEDQHVKVSGRDYTAVLLDTEWDPKKSVASGDDLQVVVQRIADEAAPEGTRARFLVVWNGVEPPPAVGSLHRSTKRKGLWVKPGKTYWDVIWDLCLQHAYVPRVDGSTIVIEEPITQTKRSLEFAPRLIYGQTLTKLEIKRKFSHEKVPQIIITAWDPDTEKLIEIVYPEKRNITVGQAGTTDALGIPLTVKKDDQVYLPAPKGITDPKALKRYARMEFYRRGRGETVYNLQAKHLVVDDVVMDGAELSLLRLKPGYAVGVHFEPFNQEHLRALQIGQRVEFITSRGYHPAVAQFIAENIDRIELLKQDYYYNRGNFTYSIDDGIEIEIEAGNFASEVREVFFAEQSDAQQEVDEI